MNQLKKKFSLAKSETFQLENVRFLSFTHLPSVCPRRGTRCTLVGYTILRESTVAAVVRIFEHLRRGAAADARRCTANSNLKQISLGRPWYPQNGHEMRSPNGQTVFGDRHVRSHRHDPEVSRGRRLAGERDQCPFRPHTDRRLFGRQRRRVRVCLICR